MSTTLPAKTYPGGPAGALRRGYSFTTHATTRPNEPAPGDRLDAEIDRIDRALAAVFDLLSRHFDTAGNPHPVGLAQLDPGVLPAIRAVVLPDLTPALEELRAARAAVNLGAGSALAAASRAESAVADAAGAGRAVQAESARAQALVADAEARLLDATTEDDLAGNEADHAAQSAGEAAASADLAGAWAEYLDGGNPIPPYFFPAKKVSGNHWSARWWAGEAAKAVSRLSAATVSDTPPINGLPGQLWFDSATAELYVWYDDPTSGQWVIANSGAGGGGGVDGSDLYVPLTGNVAVTGPLQICSNVTSSHGALPASFGVQYFPTSIPELAAWSQTYANTALYVTNKSSTAGDGPVFYSSYMITHPLSTDKHVLFTGRFEAFDQLGSAAWQVWTLLTDIRVNTLGINQTTSTDNGGRVAFYGQAWRTSINGHTAANQIIPVWSAGTFVVGQQCLSVGYLYQCTTAGSSTAAPTGAGTGINNGGTAVFATVWGQSMEAAVIECRSQTSLSSSIDGPMRTLELDLMADGPDDGFMPGHPTSRVCLTLDFFPQTPTGQAEFAGAISIAADPAHTTIQKVFKAAGNYSQSVIDTRDAVEKPTTGITPWAAGTFVYGQRCSNVQFVYQCMVPGTSTTPPTSHTPNTFISAGGTARFKFVGSLVAHALWTATGQSIALDGFGQATLSARPLDDINRALVASVQLEVGDIATQAAVTIKPGPDLNSQAGISATGAGLAFTGPVTFNAEDGGWSNANYGRQVFLTTSTPSNDNPMLGISDTNGTNLLGIGNSLGTFVFAAMPGLTDHTTPPATMLTLSPTRATFSVPATLGQGFAAPIHNIITAAYTVLITDTTLLLAPPGACVLTLLPAISYPGRFLMLKLTNANAVSSATANVVPLAGGAPITAILAGTAGKWAVLQSDGTLWQIISAN